MIAINRIRGNGRPDPPWAIDPHADLFVELDPTQPHFQVPKTLQLPGPQQPGSQQPGFEPARTPEDPFSNPASPLKYSLLLNLMIGNLNPFSISFDTLVIRFHHPPQQRELHDVIEQVTIITEDGNLITNYSYERVNYTRSPSDEKPKRHRVQSETLVGFPAFSLGAFRQIEKHYCPQLSLQLYRREIAISHPMHAIIPHDVPLPVRDPFHDPGEKFDGVAVRFSE